MRWRNNPKHKGRRSRENPVGAYAAWSGERLREDIRGYLESGEPRRLTPAEIEKLELTRAKDQSLP